MKTHVVTGGCGFVGRNLVKRLLQSSKDFILIIDDLSSGIQPNHWLKLSNTFKSKNILFYEERVIYINDDVRSFFKNYKTYLKVIEEKKKVQIHLGDVFHFAAIVGGRIKIENDPLAVAIDLSIDAEFFNWVSKIKPERVLYPSSSAAYPTSFQTKQNHKALAESDINFETINKPDMTYGWSKLTGEYLARMAAQKYDIKVTCIRPFSGYGEDQDLSYPIPAITKRIALKQNPIEVWGDGTQCRDFIHIDDVIDCMLLAMEKIHDGSAVNIGSGLKTSFLDIIKTLSEIRGYSPEIKTRLDKPVGVHSRYSDMSFVKSNWAWSPKVSLREGLEKILSVQMRDLSTHSSKIF